MHTAQTIGRIAREPDETRPCWRCALAVRALRIGSVCIDLAHRADDRVRRAPRQGVDLVRAAVAGARRLAGGLSQPARWSPPARDQPGGRPLRLADGLLYLERYWQQEEQVRESLAAAVRRRPAGRLDRLDWPRAFDRLFPGTDSAADEPDRQQLAAAVSALGRVTVLAGGPGTGKTTTVARLLALLHDQPGPPPRVALAAPTGKAAARLDEAVRGGHGELAAERPGPARRSQRLDPAPAARLAARQSRAGSGTTRTTSCRTTWWSSTRCRWCR